MRQALEALAHYANRMNEALFLTIEDAGEVVVLREELVVGGGSVRQSTELAIGVAFRALQVLLGPGWKARRVCFAHHAPADRSVHERVFGPANVEFGHDFNGVVCRSSDLDIPNPQADPVLARYARGLIEADLSKRGTGVATQVRRLVIDMLAGGKCSIDEAARHLGVTRRTVHRHLEAEGQTFSRIVDEVRRGLARRYVSDKNRTLAEVSMLLGFSAPSGFSRWYRRHFDAPASQRRKRAPRRAR
jgi:AraC-like DNA-binding protein